MIHHFCQQNTDEWRQLRCGIPTASCFSRIVTKKKLELSAAADDYMAWLLAEWMLDAPLESVETQYMQRGHDLEPHAAKSYEFQRNIEVQECGFFTTDSKLIGASPDRLAGSDGELEIKCPMPQTHARYMMGAGVDDEYRLQLMGQLWVAEREWADIISYCPPLPDVIIRVNRDEAVIGKLSAAVNQFVDRMLEARAKLTQQYGPFERRAPKQSQPAAGEFITQADAEIIIRERFPQTV